ncbi:MAG: hypothetical protein ABSG57_07440 [Candidatus Bathyarchaeia archaeon]
MAQTLRAATFVLVFNGWDESREKAENGFNVDSSLWRALVFWTLTSQTTLIWMNTARLLGSVCYEHLK